MISNINVNHQPIIFNEYFMLLKAMDHNTPAFLIQRQYPTKNSQISQRYDIYTAMIMMS